MKKLTLLFFAMISLTYLLCAQNPKWINYTRGDIIYALASEANTIWIGTNGGLAMHDKTNGITQFYNKANSGLPVNNIRSITIDEEGTKWIGTDGGGLVAFDGTNWMVYDTSNSLLHSNFITALALEANGKLWIGTENDGFIGGGLAAFDGTTWTSYNTSNSGLPYNYVQSIAIDEEGKKWIGTFDGGLAVYDDTNWTVYHSYNSGLPASTVTSISIDKNGIKWIGTYRSNFLVSEGGLAAFDGSIWTVYKVSNSGLPSDYVSSIAIDLDGTKWMGTKGGLAAYNEGGLPAGIYGKVEPERGVHVYPNPVNDVVNIKIISNQNFLYIEIFNMQGLMIKGQKCINPKTAIDVSNFPAGTYLLRLQAGEVVVTEKLVVMR